jgi:hypothetical protein
MTVKNQRSVERFCRLTILRLIFIVLIGSCILDMHNKRVKGLWAEGASRLVSHGGPWSQCCSFYVKYPVFSPQFKFAARHTHTRSSNRTLRVSSLSAFLITRHTFSLGVRLQSKTLLFQLLSFHPLPILPLHVDLVTFTPPSPSTKCLSPKPTHLLYPNSMSQSTACRSM